MCFAIVLVLLAGAFRAIAGDTTPDVEVVRFIAGELAPEDSSTVDGESAAKEESSTLEELPEASLEADSAADEDSSASDESVDEDMTQEAAPEASEQEVSEGLELLTPQEAKEDLVEPKPEEEVGRFFGPLPTRNQHPVHLMCFNFHAERARVLSPGKSEFAFRFDGANNMVKKTEDGTIVDLDFEGWNYQFEYRRGLDAGEVTVLVPLRDNTHGFMDNIIDSWHGFFGFKRGDRPDYPANDYRFFLRNAQGNVLNIPSDKLGLADISLMWKAEIGGADPQRTLSYRAALKLPTGDPDDGLGSGGADIGVGLAYERLGRRWAGYANLNYIINGDTDFTGFEANNVWTGCLACEYRLRPTWWVTGQINFAQYPLTTGISTLDRDSQELLFGFHKLLSKRVLFSGGFSEDIRTNTGPDFGITGELRWVL
ncbi:MAG: hypothetical protein A2Y63_02990 [Candidatus Riflebacteria bacterium RBG_13_59_9]|nr:MAG: hypothetical protein A2Y63_02990 [Candidatus Riflebacteria bacterium RBG_13_59_9]